jgi:diguanylate cyclase (GGDEF)-like protein
VRVVEAELKTRAAVEELRAQATRDALTGLWNRREADRLLGVELARVERGLQALCVCLVDVDHFKSINDSFGHRVGDQVLVEVAARLAATCRRYDSVARWGGEEFLVICPGVAASAAEHVAERLRGCVCGIKSGGDSGTPRSLTVSVGASAVDRGSRASAQLLLEAADGALYASKAAGRDRSSVRPIARLAGSSSGGAG